MYCKPFLKMHFKVHFKDIQLQHRYVMWPLCQGALMRRALRGKMPGRGRKDSPGTCGATYQGTALAV